MIITLGFINFNLKEETFFLLKKLIIVFIAFFITIISICIKYNYLYISIFITLLIYITLEIYKLILKQAYGLHLKDSLTIFSTLKYYITKEEVEILKKELIKYRNFEERNNFLIIFTELTFTYSFNNKDNIYKNFEEIDDMLEIIKKNK